MAKEYQITGVKFWKNSFADLKPNDTISAYEYKKRYSELLKLLQEDKVFSSFSHFYGSKYESDKLDRFESKLRYVVIPYKLVEEVLTDWDTSINHGVSWTQAKNILEGKDKSTTPLTKLINHKMLDTFKSYGLARPLVNLDSNPFWDEKYTHRLKFTSYIKSDIPYFIKEEINVLKGKGRYTENNIKLDIEVHKSKYRYKVNDTEVGVSIL
jgi:hypothetical protein